MKEKKKKEKKTTNEKSTNKKQPQIHEQAPYWLEKDA